MTLTTEILHKCSLQHRQLPPPLWEQSDTDENSSDKYNLTPESYDATELANAISAIVKRDDLTSLQSALIYGFVTDYLSAPSTEDMTTQELYDFLGNMLVQIDEYFFQGGLTLQPEDPYIKLITPDQSHLSRDGFYEPMMYVADRIVIYLRSGFTGKRRSKNDLVTTLVHELAHAYLRVFFNRCPVRGELNLVFENDGHGVLWQRISRDIYTHIRTWDPSLIGIGNKFDAITSESFFNTYYRILENLPWLLSEWRVTDLRWFEPNIFRLWCWKPKRKELLKEALLRLSYDGYTHFVSTRVPYPGVPYKIYTSFLVLLTYLKIFGPIAVVAFILGKLLYFFF
ncbi:hypothetical protein F4680DRAFT_443336 [Xylaria scruposa]|nr:hypothetical protein F4680DRAFT_443336 [Xylaria scruposa]